MKEEFCKYGLNYLNKLQKSLNESNLEKLYILSNKIYEIWDNENNFFICGNGGSAANAEHIANDFHYGIAEMSLNRTKGLKVDALTSNSGIVTCLANDIGYENIFSYQLSVKARKQDLLLILSGSGNSPNIIKALEKGKDIGMTTCAILGYDGGRAKEIADLAIHYDVSDMQISEDMQMISMNICMQWITQLIK